MENERIFTPDGPDETQADVAVEGSSYGNPGDPIAGDYMPGGNG